jgi:photosystem II stability/assembly factor-like uncharacterized protein
MRGNRLALAALLAASCAAMFTGCSCGTQTVAPPLPPLSAVQVTPPLDTLVVGGQRQFSAVALDTNNVVVAGAAIDWSSSVTGVATISHTGLLTAVGEGVTQVVASAGGKADTATVAVFFQPGWYAQPSSTTNSLWGVFFLPDGRNGWAVGDAGTIVHTTDAGASWSAQISSTSFSLRAVWFTSAQVGYAAGFGGTVMRTQNGGTNWSRINTLAASENFNDICFADAAHGWAVGSNGVIARTADGGTSWTKSFPTAQELQGVSFPDTTNGWAVGQGGVIAGTRDGGRSWYVVQPSVTSNALYSVWRRSDTEAWAGGAAGVNPVTVSTPDSLQWTLGSFGASNTIHGVMMGSSLIGYAVGTNGPGLILKTVDGASSWGPQTSNSAQALNDVWFVDPLRGWAVGTGGRIVHTAKGGE